MLTKTGQKNIKDKTKILHLLNTNRQRILLSFSSSKSQNCGRSRFLTKEIPVVWSRCSGYDFFQAGYFSLATHGTNWT